MAEEAEANEETTAEEPAERRNGSGPGFILGVLLGGIAGAAAATLLAPSGAEESRQPTEPASPFAEGAPETPVDRVRAFLARVRTRVQEASEEGRLAVSETEERSKARYAELTRQTPPPN